MKRANLAILCFLFALAGAGLTVTAVFSPFLLLEFVGSNYLTVALLFALPSLGHFIGGNFWGPAIDKVGKCRPILLTASLMSFLLFLLLANLSNPWLFIIFAATTSFFLAAIIAASKVYVTLDFPNSMGRTLGWLFTFEAIGFSVASFLSGQLLERASSHVVGGRMLLYSMAALWFVGSLVVLAFREESALPGHHEKRRQSMFQELATIYGNKELSKLSLSVFLINGANMVLFGMFSTYFCKHLGGGQDLLGGALAAAGIGAAVISVKIGAWSDRFGHWNLLRGAAIGYMLLLGLMSCLQDPRFVALLYALPLYPALSVGASAAAAQMTNKEKRGGGAGVVDGVLAISGFIGAVTGGAVVQLRGFSPLPKAAAMVAALGVLVTLYVSMSKAKLKLKPSFPSEPAHK